MSYQDPFGTYMARQQELRTGTPYYSGQQYYQAPQQQIPAQPAAPSPAQQLAQSVVNAGIKKGINYGAESIGGMSSAAAPAGVVEGGVGTAIDGSTMMANPAFTAEAPGAFSSGTLGAAGNVIGTIAALKGGYDTINGLQHGGEGLRGGLTTAGAGVGQLIGGPLGAGAGAILGNIAGYGLQGDGWKNKLALTAVMPPLGVAKMLGFNPIHKTTRQSAQEHTSDLLKQNKDDSKYQDYIKSIRAGYDRAPETPDTPFAGKYRNWDEYKAAGLQAGDLSGVYGNLKTFGKDWTDIDQSQREQITQGLIKADLYKSKRGEVEITDAERAKQVYADIAKSFTKKK
jgi:hypothetical protein